MEPTTPGPLGSTAGLGEATIGRWENGLVIQNYASDRYVRLLAKE